MTNANKDDAIRGSGSAADPATAPGRRKHEHETRLDIDWVKTIAGALAAVSSAVLLSTLGAAGTLVGAALGSVVVTVGGALYTQGLAQGRGRLAHAPVTARSRGIRSAALPPAHLHPGNATEAVTNQTHDEQRPDEASKSVPAASVGERDRSTRWRERLSVIPWMRVGLGAIAMFVATILAITAFEVIAGRSLSSIVGGSDGGGGTTITRLDGSDRDTSRDNDQAPSDEKATPSEPPPGESPDSTDVTPESPPVLTTPTPATDPSTTMPATDPPAPTSVPGPEVTATPSQ